MDFGFSLLGGYGCYINIERDFNGSYGTVNFAFKDPNLYIFDSYLHTVTSGMELGMFETGFGWDPRTFFIVNRGAAPIEFSAKFNAGLLLRIAATVAAVAMTLIV